MRQPLLLFLVSASRLRVAVSSAAPLGLNKYISMLNPGLVPWAMKVYRPFRAHCKNGCILKNMNVCTVEIGMGVCC